MELKHYLRILALRWPVIAIPVVLVCLLVIYQEVGRPVTWSTQVRASIIRDLDPPPPDAYAYDGYYNYLASEFAIDDLVEALRGNVFSQAVAERLNAGGASISGGEVHNALEVSRMHRIMTMTVSASDRERAVAIAQAAAAEIDENAFRYISVSAAEPAAMVRIIQRPEEPGRDVSRERLLMLVELVAAAGFGVLLAFLVHYLDDRVHDAETAAATLRLPLLAQVVEKRR